MSRDTTSYNETSIWKNNDVKIKSVSFLTTVSKMTVNYHKGWLELSPNNLPFSECLEFDSSTINVQSTNMSHNNHRKLCNIIAMPIWAKTNVR